jgi:hypothetical protein
MKIVTRRARMLCLRGLLAAADGHCASAATAASEQSVCRAFGEWRNLLACSPTSVVLR